MKIIRILPLLAFAALPASFAKADIVIELAAGQLLQANGTTPIPDGALIQLVASTTDATFSAPTSGSFTGNSSDDIVLASFSLDSSTGGLAGTFQHSVTLNSLSLPANLTVGDPLMLRWFPTLTTSSSSPGAGTICGQYRTDATLDGSGGGWFLPSDGNYPLNFLTVSAGGSVANSAGVANLTAVPEPSAYGLLGAGALTALAMGRRRKA